MRFRIFHVLRQFASRIPLQPAMFVLALVLSAPAIGQQPEPKAPAKDAATESEPAETTAAETTAAVANVAEMAVDDKLSRKGRNTIPTMLRDGVSSATFDEYFSKFLFSRMTRLGRRPSVAGAVRRS